MQAVSNLWLPIPQTVYLLKTGNLRKAREFPEDGPDPNFLVFLVSRALTNLAWNVAFAHIVPLDPTATKEQRIDALEAIRQSLASASVQSELGVYGTGLKALRQILVDGLITGKASRSPEGPFEVTDPVEFTRLDLAGEHAVHSVTKRVVLYNVRVSARELLNLRQAVLSGAVNIDELQAADGKPSRPKPSGGWQKLQWIRAREVAMEWLVDNGCPARGDGKQAELERHIASWLTNNGYEAKESSIRRHVSGWIEERRRDLGIQE